LERRTVDRFNSVGRSAACGGSHDDGLHSVEMRSAAAAASGASSTMAIR
jgi:hypothetical protein